MYRYQTQGGREGRNFGNFHFLSPLGLVSICITIIISYGNLRNFGNFFLRKSAHTSLTRKNLCIEKNLGYVL
jgi:hypothetical protein